MTIDEAEFLMTLDTTEMEGLELERRDSEFLLSDVLYMLYTKSN